MERSPRHHAAAAGLALVLSAAGTACIDDEACPADAIFAVTAPAGFAELVRGGPPVSIEWTFASQTATWQLGLADGARAFVLADLGGATRAFSFDGTADAAPVPAGNYHVTGEVWCGGASLHVDGGPLHLVVVQGVRFRDATLRFTGAQPQAERTVVVATVARSPMDVELIAAAAGDERVFARATIPGELVAFERSYPFTGLDVDGAELPAGTYTIRARVHARAGLTYDEPGPTLDWQPASAR